MLESVAMRKNSPLLGAIVALLTFAGVRRAEATAGDNAREFAVLCKLKSIATTSLEKFELKDFGSLDKIYEDAEKKFVSFGGKSGERKEENKAEGEKKEEEDSGISLEDVLQQVENKEENVQTTTSPEIRKLALILKKINVTKNDAEKTKTDIEKKEKEIRENLAAALYGEAVVKDGVKDGGGAAKKQDFSINDAVSKIKFTADRNKNDVIQADADTACGGADSVATVAQSLVGDLFCLCIGGAGGEMAENHVCANGIQGNGNTWGQANIGGSAKGDFAAAWSALAPICDKLAPVKRITPHGIDSALANFFALIGGAHQAGDAKSNFMFGKNAAASGGCLGKSTKTCVDYGGLLGKGHPIPWVQKFQDAETKLIERAELIQKLKDEKRHLESLAHAAQMIQKPFVEATATTQTAQASKTASAQLAERGKESSATASDPGAAAGLSAPSTSRLILPWALLI